jgi:hypothetical protein
MLKTDFVEGDIFYAGATTDNDKLNGITNTINQKGAPLEIYTGSGFNSTITGHSGVSNSNNHTLSFSPTTANYITIKILAYQLTYAWTDGGNPTIEGKIEIKDVGGSFSTIFDAVIQKNISRATSTSVRNDTATIPFEMIYQLTNDMKTNGFEIKITTTCSITGGSSNSTATITNRQTIIRQI